MTKIDEKIFKAYDIRGVADEQITEQTAYLIGRAYAQVIAPNPAIVGVGRDVRKSGDVLEPALIQGLLDEGVEVISLGTITTDMLYFGVGYYELGGGIAVTASHNPAEYNGFKLVRERAEPISSESGITEIKEKVISLSEQGISYSGEAVLSHVHTKEVIRDDYIQYLSRFVDLNRLWERKTPFKVAFNANHGVGGEIVELMVEKLRLPLEYVGIYMGKDGSFPQGRPDPLYEVNQRAFSEFVTKNNCDFGVAWDADADRCFFFDENGEFVDGYYTAALLAGIMLDKYPGEKIIHDPRLTWAVRDIVSEKGGTALVNKVGHSFIKARMKKENAVFAGENSGHYYFRDYWYADNGMIPFLLMLELLDKKNSTMSELVASLREKYHISGELNMQAENIPNILERIESNFSEGKIEKIDGLSVEFEDWRFNLRASNTEPLLRLNVEATSRKVLEEKTEEVMKIIKEQN